MYSITSFIPFWYCDKSIALGNEGQNLTFGGAHLFNKLEIEHPKTCFEANSGYIYIEYNRFLIWYESFVLIVTWSMRVECLPSNRSRSLNLPASKMIQMHPLIKISIFFIFIRYRFDDVVVIYIKIESHLRPTNLSPLKIRLTFGWSTSLSYILRG